MFKGNKFYVGVLISIGVLTPPAEGKVFQVSCHLSKEEFVFGAHALVSDAKRPLMRHLQVDLEERTLCMSDRYGKNCYGPDKYGIVDVISDERLRYHSD